MLKLLISLRAYNSTALGLPPDKGPSITPVIIRLVAWDNPVLPNMKRQPASPVQIRFFIIYFSFFRINCDRGQIDVSRAGVNFTYPVEMWKSRRKNTWENNRLGYYLKAKDSYRTGVGYERNDRFMGKKKMHCGGMRKSYYWNKTV